MVMSTMLDSMGLQLQPSSVESSRPARLQQSDWALFIVLPLVLAFLLALVWYRGERPLGIDAFYYTEYTKEIRALWLPREFGTGWPRGLPFVGSLVTHFGVSAYWALCFISIASLVGLLLVSAKFLTAGDNRRDWFSVVAMCALCASPVITWSVFANMSELLFSFLLLLMAYLITKWPNPTAIWTSALVAFLGFTVKYAGIFAFGVLAVCFVLDYRRMREARGVRVFLGAMSCFTFLAVLCLGLNILTSGSISGMDRQPGDGLVKAPLHAAHLGWAIPGSFSSPSVSRVVGQPGSSTWLVAGLLFLAVLAGLMAWAYWRPRHRHTRTLVVVAGSYVAAMIMLRSINSFADLSVPRYFQPALFPAAVILAQAVTGKLRTVAALGAVGAIVLGSFCATRGISKETYSELEFARRELVQLLDDDSTIVVSEHISSLSAYFANRFTYWGEVIQPGELIAHDYVVIGAERIGRAGEESAFSPFWRSKIDELNHPDSGFHLVSSNESTMIWGRVPLERVPPDDDKPKGK